MLLGHHAMPLTIAPAAAGSVSVVGVLTTLGACLFAMGTGEALGRAAADFPQPKIRNLRRAALAVSGYSLLISFGSALLFVVLVPPPWRSTWHSAPIAGAAW